MDRRTHCIWSGILAIMNIGDFPKASTEAGMMHIPSLRPLSERMKVIGVLLVLGTLTDMKHGASYAALELGSKGPGRNARN